VILDTTTDRMLIVSDLHLGNPASTAEKRLLGFLDHAADIGASVCINGDGFDVLQMSFSRLVSAGLPVLSRLRHVQAAGGTVHYIVGNHDIVLEHFLDHVLSFEMSPFLNVRCGDAHIRVEHGHVYDPFFARYPRLYGAATRAAGLALWINRDVYQAWTYLSDRADIRRRRRAGDDVLGYSYCHEAAEMLLSRGFDAVVFGHTHNAEVTELPSGTYLNAGNWLRGQTYVDIDHGRISLQAWEPVASVAR
jgi:UDP-2,3-diacylglucosamine pyrophosphatase LpxH